MTKQCVLRALLAQLEPRARSITDNVRRAADLVQKYADVDLAVFPELFLTGYQTERLHELALAPDDPRLAPLREQCRRHGMAVIVGLVEQSDPGICNSLLCIDEKGHTASTYRKTHLFGEEAELFAPGDDLSCVELAGKTVGPLICYDIELPEPARLLAVGGAQVLVSISANMAPYWNDHELASRARALDNRLPHLYVNRVGTEGRFSFVGGSRVVAADGQVLYQASDQESVAVVEVPINQHVPDDVNYLQHLRPELYGHAAQADDRC